MLFRSILAGQRLNGLMFFTILAMSACNPLQVDELSTEPAKESTLSVFELEVRELIAESGLEELNCVPLTPTEVKAVLEDDVARANYRSANNGSGVSGLIIVCYDCEGPSETCFAIHGTDDCGDVNCGDGCCCY